MFKAFFALGFVLYLLVLPGAFAGPSCARRNRNKQSCMSLCAQKWGWPGNVMGSDPWGAVISPKGSSPSDALSTACGNGNSGGALGSGSGNSNTTIVVVTSTTPSPASSSLTPSTLVATSSFSTVIKPPSPSTTSSPSSKSSSGFFSSSTPANPPASSSSSPQASSTPSKPSLTTFQQIASSPSPSQTQPAQQTHSQQNQPQQSSNSNNQPSGNSDVQQMLQLHNNLRASHGAGPLTWSSTLASKAQQWANGCVFEHSGGSLGPFGENLASGTGSSYGASDAFKGWADEESSYDPNNPQPSHFTQVVWKGSTQLGCAVTTCAPGKLFSSSFGSAKYYVCEYEAQGNVIGEFGSNVQA